MHRASARRIPAPTKTVNPTVTVAKVAYRIFEGLV